MTAKLNKDMNHYLTMATQMCLGNADLSNSFQGRCFGAQCANDPGGNGNSVNMDR